jgi:hypothetical protein
MCPNVPIHAIAGMFDSRSIAGAATRKTIAIEQGGRDRLLDTALLPRKLSVNLMTSSLGSGLHPMRHRALHEFL